MKRDQAQLLVREVGAMIGIPDLDLDEHGACTLSLREGRFHVSVLNDADGSLTLVTTLREVEPSEAVLRCALEANHLWLGTRGATFAVNASTGQVTLSELPTRRRRTTAARKASPKILDGCRARRRTTTFFLARRQALRLCRPPRRGWAPVHRPRSPVP